MVGEFELPEQIIHHIQSFLTGKEAVRSSVLSKSWHRAWTTRPNLDFDEDDFRHKDDEFLKFVNKTIKRYEEMKLKIDGLRLRVNSSSVLPKKLIPQALRMGATRLDIGGGFVVPNVVFKAENLVRLSVDDCKIKRHRVRVVKYPRLESLSLTNVEISSSVICRIISGCPSIKTLSLTNLLSSSGRLYCHGLAVEGRICCHALTTLVLCNVFFCGDDLFSEFPSLKDLTLHDLMTDLKEIRVSSRSLERLKLVSFPGSSLYHTFKLDVPSLRRFTFDGYLSQRMTVASASRNLVSCLTLIEEGHLSTTLFKKLGNFLTELGQSEVHLCLHLYLRTILNYVPGDFEGLPKHEVANCTIDVYGMSFINCYILFDGLFRIIRPKFVKHYLHPTSTSENTNNDFLGKRLLEGVNGSICSIESHFMRSVHDLKEVNVQLFDEDASEWTTISWDSFFDASTSTNRKQQVCFQLEWKP